MIKLNFITEDFKKNKLLIIVLSSIPLLIHLYVNMFGGYGYFRDELYYIACSDHLDLGYVDHPPLSIYILKLFTIIFGKSIFSIRLLPAIGSALTVFITCLMTLKLGGKKFSLILSSAAVIFAPIYLGMFSLYTMNSIDILLWSAAFYMIMTVLESDKRSDWITLGIILGLGLLNKISFLWLGFGFFIGLLLTDNRKVLRTTYPYLCALIALAIFSPYIIWNVINDFAHLEFIRNATSQKYSGLDAAGFLKGQILNMNPVSVIVWLSGLYYFLFDKNGKRFRIFGIIYIATLVILIINGHSKAEYLSPVYTILFAGGSVFIERLTTEKYHWFRYAVTSLIVMLEILVMPLAIPVLPVESYIKYANSIGFGPSSSENKELSELPQHFADMFGWEELASNVSIVYMTLSPDAQKRSVVYCNNYGEASAINFFRKEYLLPKAISGHNSYWLWGPEKIKDPVVIIIGGNKEELMKTFDYVEEVIIHKAKYSMPYENNLPIFVGRQLKTPLDSLWGKVKHYE